MKTINNVVYTPTELKDYRSESALDDEEQLIDELEARLSDLEWIFDEWMTVSWSFVTRYREILDELDEPEDSERVKRWESRFGLYGDRWEVEMGWDV